MHRKRHKLVINDGYLSLLFDMSVCIHTASLPWWTLWQASVLDLLQDHTLLSLPRCIPLLATVAALVLGGLSAKREEEEEEEGGEEGGRQWEWESGESGNHRCSVSVAKDQWKPGVCPPHDRNILMETIVIMCTHVQYTYASCACVPTLWLHALTNGLWLDMYMYAQAHCR